MGALPSGREAYPAGQPNRWSHNWRKPSQLALDLLTEFTDHLSVRKILQGVKGRVEGRIEPMARANTEFAIYLAGAWIFVGAIVLTLLRPLTWGRWLAGLAAGAAARHLVRTDIDTDRGSIGALGSMGLGRCIPQACLTKSRLTYTFRVVVSQSPSTMGPESRR